MPIHPSPIADTEGPFVPNVLFILFLFDVPKIMDERIPEFAISGECFAISKHHRKAPGVVRM